MTVEEESVEEVVEKQKRTATCRECGSNLASGAMECQNCGSRNIRKHRYVIRKETLKNEPSAEEEVPDYDEMEEVPDAPKSDNVFKGHYEDDEDDEGMYEDDEPEEDEEEMPNKLRVMKNISGDQMAAVNTEIVALAMDLAEKVSKALTGDDQTVDYEAEMDALNKAFDAAFDTWKHGETLSKNDRASMMARLKMLKRKFKELTGEDFDSSDMSKADDVTKSDTGTEDIYKGLHPDIAKRLQAADELVEKNAVAEWETVAKSFDQVPANYAALGAALRSISETVPDAFTVIKSVLDAVNTNLNESNVFKSFAGNSIQGLPSAADDQMENLAKSWHEAGKYATIEQARVAVMDANPSKFYQSTGV